MSKVIVSDGKNIQAKFNMEIYNYKLVLQQNKIKHYSNKTKIKTGKVTKIT